jgi:two-component system phosphate regulon sensor histidine kinase PhoR
MKTSTIRLIVFLAGLSLVGLIITQSFWVYRGIKIGQRHFENKVQMALKSTVDELSRSADTCSVKCRKLSNDSAIIALVPPKVLDSLLNKYFEYFHIRGSFDYAIIRSKTDTKVFSSHGFVCNIENEKVFRNCLSCLYNKEHYHIAVIFQHKNRHNFYDIFSWLLLSITFMVIIILCFSFIIFAVFRHKKLSEMKTDFINNMSHELKTPISTISLASEVLLDCSPQTDSDRVAKYAKIIFDENQRMRLQVENVLRLSRLDKGELELAKEEIDVHELIKSAVYNLCYEECDRPVSIVYDFNAENYLIQADPIHLTNIIINLVENAYKYSTDEPEITIKTANVEKGLQISVCDKGIGISPDLHKVIFEKFFRVPTGNVHNVKGFGIGLYYVKEMIKAHGGTISLTSEPGKGSCFEIVLPFS